MISRPDYMAKQVVLVKSDEFKTFKLNNNNLVFLDENNKKLLQHSFHKIFVVFIVGDFTITSKIIKKAKKFSVPIIFLNYNLRPFHKITAGKRGNVLLRKKQYTELEDLEIAKLIVRNKIENQIYLMKSLRYKTPTERESIKKVEDLLIYVESSISSQELLGIEGTASKIFFPTYFKNLDFKSRKPRTKIDVINLLFDIGYHYLFNYIEANLELYDFDLYFGVYHKVFYQRKSLVCDIIEPFRCIIDKKIRKGFNLNQISYDHFYYKNGQYFVRKDYSKKYSEFFIREILKYKEEIFLYVKNYYRAIIKEKNINSFPRFYIKKGK